MMTNYDTRPSPADRRLANAIEQAFNGTAPGKGSGNTTLTEIRDELRLINGGKEDIPIDTTLFSLSGILATYPNARIRGILSLGNGATIGSTNASGSVIYSDADLRARYVGKSLAIGSYVSFGENIIVTEITLSAGSAIAVITY